MYTGYSDQTSTDVNLIRAAVFFPYQRRWTMLAGFPSFWFQ